MSSKYFRIDEHVVDGQYIRHYTHATRHGDEDVLKIAVKQYTPLNNKNPQPGDVTIIAAHANAFPKELYEPLWDELLARSKTLNFRIRSIWITDVAHQGQSSVLNEGKLGNDPSWFDHPRDLLHVVNTFRHQMPRPIIGMGHSMGGAQLTSLSLMHPRLFHTLILMDPVIQRVVSVQGNIHPAVMSTFRRDIWPSRSAAMTAFKKSKFYQTWDPRVLDAWVKHGLRELPTEVYPADQTSAAPSEGQTAKPVMPIATTEPTTVPFPAEKPVTLTTTKHQEVFTFLRPSFPPGPPTGSTTLSQAPVLDRLMHPELDPTIPPTTFYRPEAGIIFANLPHLRPSVLYIFGAESNISAKPFREDKLAVTGTGVGGSGGVKEGRVDSVLFEGVGHLIPMEVPEKTADECAKWFQRELARYRQEERALAEMWSRKPEEERYKLSKESLAWLGSHREEMIGEEKEKRGKSKL